MRIIVKKIINNIRLFSIGFIFILLFSTLASACTGFTASYDEKVLVGSNEDSFKTRRYVEIFPPEEEKFGIIYFCYEQAFRQQAMNDKGLFYDGYWAPHLDIKKGEGKPPPDGWMIDEWMETCSTVDEIIDQFDNYDWRDTGLEDAMLFFVDRQGNSTIIEGDDIIYKEGDYQAVTNYYQSHPELGGYGFVRYATAISMLENMTDFSMEYFRDICDATHQVGSYPTIYSIVCDLTKNIIYYYYHHDFENVWEINLTEEFEFGEHSYDVLDVFNNNAPDKPNRPNGRKSGKTNTEYTFTCKTLDEDGDKLYYKWDWGDGNFSKWLGPYSSTQKCTAIHHWSHKGYYEVRVIARDNNSGKSDWSEPLLVNMPRMKNHIIDLSGWLERFPVLYRVLKFINNFKTYGKDYFIQYSPKANVESIITSEDEVELKISAGFRGKNFGLGVAVNFLNHKTEEVNVFINLTLDYIFNDNMDGTYVINETALPKKPSSVVISPVICYPDGIKFITVTAEAGVTIVTRSGISIRNLVFLF